MKTKSILQSRTIWFNAVTILVVVASFYGYVPDQELANRVSNVLLVVAPLVNLVLRYFTSKALTI